MNRSQVCTPGRPPLVLKALTAADLMTPNPASLSQGATAREAAAFLTGRGISAAPVISESGAPVGVLSQTDLVIHGRESAAARANAQAGAEDFTEFAEVPCEPRGFWEDVAEERVDDTSVVRDLMTPTVFTVRLDAPAAQVVEDMLALRVHRLFVVDEDGVLVGVVSATDVLRCLEPAPEDAA
jgi:CBS domain-containing protein